MKKQILLFTISIFSLGAYAQTPTVGVEAGYSSFGINGEASKNLNNLIDFADGMLATQSRSGFYAGLNTAIPISKSVVVQPGLYYAQKGYELRGNFAVKGLEFLGANARARLQNDYIDIPVLIKANVADGLQVYGGPQISYLSSSKLKINAGALGFDLFSQTIDAKEQFNQWDLGLVGGLGYEFKNGFNINASYNHGLSRVDANKNVKGYNNGFKVGIGLRF
ncbi:MAG TPA: porin family protein [Ferruginibacter sp.]|nr:porin family protein [Ferruginibacter sp.]HRE64696.1 porin family protein [Ferruginibacter sp.]